MISEYYYRRPNKVALEFIENIDNVVDLSIVQGLTGLVYHMRDIVLSLP